MGLPGVPQGFSALPAESLEDPGIVPLWTLGASRGIVGTLSADTPVAKEIDLALLLNFQEKFLDSLINSTRKS